MIIGLSGKMEAGKSTVGTYLALLGDLNGIAVAQFAFADGLKDDALNYGWDGHKNPGGRFLLQKTGEERRTQKLDWWIEHLSISMAEYEEDLNVITDVRYINEAEWILARGGELWRIIRKGHEPKYGEHHESELDLDAYPFEVLIEAENGDFEGLYQRTKEEFRRVCTTGTS